jgi:hypothetical protein
LHECKESVRATRYPRHADLKKVSNPEAPKHPEILGRAIRHAPRREAFIPEVKS